MSPIQNSKLQTLNSKLKVWPFFQTKTFTQTCLPLFPFDHIRHLALLTIVLSMSSHSLCGLPSMHISLRYLYKIYLFYSILLGFFIILHNSDLNQLAEEGIGIWKHVPALISEFGAFF